MLQVVLLCCGLQGRRVSPLGGSLGGDASSCTHWLRWLQVQNTFKPESRDGGLSQEGRGWHIIREILVICRPKPASSRGQMCTCLQRVSSFCLFLFLTSILVREELKSKSAKSAQSSEPLVDLEIRPHLLLLFGFMSPLFCSRPARIFCVCKQRREKRKAMSVGFKLSFRLALCMCVSRAAGPLGETKQMKATVLF